MTPVVVQVKDPATIPEVKAPTIPVATAQNKPETRRLKSRKKRKAKNPEQQLERVLAFLLEAATVPVLLSMLVLTFGGQPNMPDARRSLPGSKYELYDDAVDAAIKLSQQGVVRCCRPITDSLARTSPQAPTLEPSTRHPHEPKL